MNGQFMAIFGFTILNILLYIFLHVNLFLYLFFLDLFLVILYVIGYFHNVMIAKHANDVRNGDIEYSPYIIDKERFIEECRSGLLYSLVRIDGNIYEIEVQLDKVNSTNYDEFVCYINDNEIIGVDNFLSYKYDDIHSFNDLEDIEFLEYNHVEPSKYFCK